MDVLFIAVAFLFGLFAQQFRLPPLVGFLVAGFVLNALGQEGGETVATVADLGVTLLLFSIGIKLRVRTLIRPEIWLGTSIHTTLIALLFTPVIFGVGALIGVGAGLDWRASLLIAFALSFSSTVFAVKTLEEGGDMGSMYGRVAIGILVMQDILAVVFLTASTGKAPSPWALVLLPALFLARPLIGKLLGRSGHGEMVMVCGLFLALVLGAKAFDAVGLKGDLGALFVGVLVGSHPKAKELSKSLLSITDLFLIGFFLQIGLNGTFSLDGAVWALVALLILPVKSLAFFLLLTRFHLRARTAFMSGLVLSNYSEFGLIVMAISVANGWVPGEWMVAVAMALSLSFLIVAPLCRRSEEFYDRGRAFLTRFETAGGHPDDLPIRTNKERIAVFGMGRIGTAVYGRLEENYPEKVIAFDRDPAVVDSHVKQGRKVLLADATDSDFWSRVSVRDDFDLAVLAMPKHIANIHAADALKRHGFQGLVAATGQFDDEVRQLHDAGIDTAFNIYSEAGSGFAQHVLDAIEQQPSLAQRWRQADLRPLGGP